MNHRNLRFAVFGNIHHPERIESTRQLLACLAAHDAEVRIDRKFFDFLRAHDALADGRMQPFEGRDFRADFVISMGGDGTFLKAASMVGSMQTPIIGINMGRLGFLADISADETDRAIGALYEGDYSVEERAVIRVETDGEPLSGYDCALNEVAILKRDDASMISIRTTVNGDYLTTYQADGLIVSTPTGSTAYSLSVGGPIIVPGTRVFAMTAVAPHSLNIRPMVIPDDAEIRLTVESRSHHFLVALDGRSEKCAEGTRLTLRRAPYAVKVVKRAGQRYFCTLREKMMWGADQRG